MITIWWSYQIPINCVWTLSLCSCYRQKNLMKTWIKVASGNGGLQNNYFLSCDLLINVTYFYAKIKSNFFWGTFLQFWTFLLMFVTILARDYMEIRFYFKYAYLKEHINIFEKKLSFGHRVILPLKHCICRKTLNFDWLYDYIPWCRRSRDNLIRFVSTKDRFSEYLLSIMWSFGHQCIFQ